MTFRHLLGEGRHEGSAKLLDLSRDAEHGSATSPTAGSLDAAVSCTPTSYTARPVLCASQTLAPPRQGSGHLKLHSS